MVCKREFVRRKKWLHNWDYVNYCGKKCMRNNMYVCYDA